MNTVSIIIPAYNEEKYIARTLSFVGELKNKAIKEVIVVDNNSSDHTAGIIKAFKDVTYLKEENQGTLYAREAGRRQATGDILLFLDADCEPRDAWLSRGLLLFDKDAIVAVSGPYNYYDSDPVFRFTSRVTQQSIYSVVHTITHDVFNKTGVMLGGNSFIRARALKNLGGFDPEKTDFYGDDTYMAKMMTECGRVVFDPHLVLRSSSRRFKEEGMIKVVSDYNANFFSMVFLDKPVSETRLAQIIKIRKEELEKNFAKVKNWINE